MIRINRVKDTTIKVLKQNYSKKNINVIKEFLNDIKTINIMKLETTAGNDLIAEYLFTDDQDVIMKFLITMLNILREDKEFFSPDKSYHRDIFSVVNEDIFDSNYRKLIIKKDAKCNDFYELLALYIMGGVPPIGRFDNV